ncbi:MAG: DinB family protein [Bacteroidota bacterium]
MYLINSVENIFMQLQQPLVQLSEDEYTKPLELLSNSSIGQHVRHTLEFFVCLQEGVKSGVVNYDKRKHDKTIEGSKSVALGTLDKVLDDLKQVNSSIKLILEGNYSGNDGSSEDYRIDTCFERELAYNIEHAIHHMAIIKIGVRAVNDSIEIPRAFGVASSTLRYENSQSS